jgi:hypothetical protein
MSVTIDDLIKEQIAKQISQQLPRVVSDLLKVTSPLPEWMTELQLAEYWQLRNPKGELTTAGIRSWSNRAPDEHPLPYSNMGEIRRYNREEADDWAREEVGCQKMRGARRREFKAAS